MNKDILVARGVRKTYSLGSARLEVVRGVNLTVRRGEALVIVGASGAGKSTLLHLLGGLDEPSAGEVFLNEISVYGLSNSDRTRLRNERIGFVFQSFNLLPELDALENVSLPLLVRGGRRAGVRERATQLLQAVGLGERLGHRPSELSGGEQQRVAIARAMMNKPELLLADEPTGNLDSKTGETILELLWKLRAETGATLVLVTHDQHIARRGDRVLEIADGTIVR
jgi:predicted ABC-type transport system involved in lysophospholipase L1 biosynthesis ATPase subunit